MSDLIKKRVIDNLGKVVLVFLKNNFRYEGKITNCDENYMEMLDFKTNSYKIINLDDIKEMEFKNG